MNWDSGRAIFARDLWRQQPFGLLGAIAGFLSAIFQNWREEWANTDTAERLRLVAILPSAAWLVAIAFAALAIWIFEAAFHRQQPGMSFEFTDTRRGLSWVPNDDTAPIFHILYVTLRNGISQKLEECQLHVRVKHKTNQALPGDLIYPISAPFSLRPDEERPVELLRYKLDENDARLQIAILREVNGKWADRAPLELAPGTYLLTVEALSANSRIARLKVKAFRDPHWSFSADDKKL